MLKSYLLVALRNLRRHPGYAALNIVGLAVGIAACLLIALFVRYELAFDRHHEYAERIVRVAMETPQGPLEVTPTVVAPLFKREMPEVEDAVRLYDIGAFQPALVRRGERVFQEEGFVYADSTVFDVFTLPFLAGTPRTALTRPRTLVLTATAARRYFDEPLAAVGETLEINGAAFEVTGVLADLPPTSHLQFDLLASFVTTGWVEDEVWHSANFLTYLLLRDEAALETLPAKVAARVAEAHAAEAFSPHLSLSLQPLRTIHLDVEGRRVYVYVFSAVAALILLIACINYMNLATARATRRAKEVGVRKATGAQRGQLVQQFYGESALLAALALVLAVGLAFLLLPAFRSLSGAALALRLDDPFLLVGLLAVFAVVTLVAGSYPALLLASFRPAVVLKGTPGGGLGHARFRKALVVFQFAVSVFLLVGTAVVYSQLRYIQTKDLGFEGEQVLILPVGDERTRAVVPALKQALLAHPGVLHASVMNRPPGYQESGYSLIADGLEVPEGTAFSIGGVRSDADIVETLGLEVVAGRAFEVPEGYEPDSGRYVYLVNEATLRATGWTAEEAIGKRMTLSGNGRWGTLVGVIRDYHFLPLHREITPLAIFVEPRWTNDLLVRLAPAAVPDALAHVEQTWQRLVPHRPFEYRFLDDAFGALYERERQVGQVAAAFALLAVLVACLGLFGLAAYAAEQRTKEIGIRKVLGARVPQLVGLLSRDFVGLVAAAFAVGAPLAYWAMDRWLAGFAYRVDIGAELFVLSGAVVGAIALLTVSYHAVRAAVADPVKSLRYE